MGVVRLGGVVEGEVVVLEEVGVIGEESDGVVDFECGVRVEVEIGDGIEGIGEMGGFVEVRGDLEGVGVCEVVGEGDGLEGEGIGLVDVDMVVGG